jgi:hypothetical protein
MGHITVTGFTLALATLAIACGSSKDNAKNGNGGPDTTPVVLDSSEYTYGLSEGTAELPLFTTPATHRLTTADRTPDAIHSGLKLSAAKREFEPVQLAIGPGQGTVKITSHPFPELGTQQRVSLSIGEYSEGIVDTLTPLGSGGTIELNSNAAVALWMTVFVPEDAPAGEHETTIELSVDGGTALNVPVKLHVFDFTLPAEAHFSTQINIGVSGLIPEGGQVDDAKTLLFEHRMTPTSATWPSGFNWNITWDNDASNSPCGTFWDEPTEGDAYSIGALAERYLLGVGWNGVGFHDAELFQFVDNSTPRPDSFCGIDRGDHYGSTAYNKEWSEWLSALDSYLVEHGYDVRGYYYIQNEPQNEADDDLANYLCRITKAAAPHLRIAISEEPKPEIAEHTNGACGYDIWIAHVRAYQEAYAWERQSSFGETVWFYSLDHDPDPYFNPTVTSNQGIHERIIPWAAWSHRIRGWAYYDGGRFFNGPYPSARAELLREGFEDYEYLWLANANAHPSVATESPIDATVKSVASSMTSWTQDADALMALRYELGRYLGGETSTLPTLEVKSSRPRGAYYINFQDPKGEPKADPLVIDGNTYIKIGWSAYNDDLGYGFRGENIDNPSIALYGFDAIDGYLPQQQSYIYDDYGRDNLFEFALAQGRYEVTVGVGRPARGYPNDPSNVTIEGTRVLDDVATTDNSPVIERKVTLDISDGSLSLVSAGRSVSTGEYSYTFLAYLTIVPVD